MRKSLKTEIIEWIFFNLKYDTSSEMLTESVVVFDDIAMAIDSTDSDLGTGNLANFWKDITRGNPNNIWPSSVFKYGYTGADAIGDAPSASFKFIPKRRSSVEPFPDLLVYEEGLRIHTVQSLSMPLTTKSLSRSDENWVVQVAQRLNIVESYFAIFSKLRVSEISFLQTGIRLGRGEVDAAYLATIDGYSWLISVEVKGRKDSVHVAQILRASNALLKSARESAPELSSVAGVIPIAMQVVGSSSIWVIEFESINRSADSILKVNEGIIELSPEVPGLK